MTVWASWRGMIARLGCDSTDGRRLVLGDFPPSHFVRLPASVIAAPPADGTSNVPWQVVGRIDRVSVRPDGRPLAGPDTGQELHGEGALNLDELWRVRPDLRSRSIESGDVAVPHDLWPVGIVVDRGEISGVDGVIVMAGPWELISMGIERKGSVWPGVGIQLFELEDDGRG